jgi:hypothetical protein
MQAAKRSAPATAATHCENISFRNLLTDAASSRPKLL